MYFDKIFRPLSRRHLNSAIGLGLAATLISWRAPSPSAAAYERKTAPFSITFEDEESAYRDTSVFIMPNSALQIHVIGGPPGEYSIKTDDGQLARRGRRWWQWDAPAKPGLFKLEVKGPPDSDTITVRAFVMVPAAEIKDGYLNGYRIGAYPDTPPSGNPLYRAPRGFIEVTRENQDTRVSPHFRLKQFVCKQEPQTHFPKYVVLEERLILHLEAILEQVNARGFDADTLHVMSGYRTPYYNGVLRDVRYSMHQFGSAADIFVDRHDKGVMDDLTRDGRVDLQDARYLHDLIDVMLMRPPFKKFEGGMGLYPATSAHPPFVHVDVRGSRARWQG
jgi:hypothetical protein